jgi:1,4-alpha-glucan branching enzyme
MGEREFMAPLASQEQSSSLLTPYDLHLFNEGKHTRLFEKFGAHITELDGKLGTHFAVWAPNADRISVVGDFNGWNPDSHRMIPQGSSGVWEAFIPELGQGAVYKYHIRSRYHMYTVDKADPYGYYNEIPPRTASIVWDLGYQWNDVEWMHNRHEHNKFEAPMSTYEVHLGSWMRVP